METYALVHPKEIEADKTITTLYTNLQQSRIKNPTLTNKLDFLSKAFLGQPYMLGALGEGADARYDQFPKYRTDGFDCDTYVTTVLALALAKNGDEFKQRLQQVRYDNNQTDYIHRNHFMELDWNANNARKGFVKNITDSFKDRNGKPVAKDARALINKPGWYQHHTEKNIRLNGNPPDAVRMARLKELKSKGAGLKETWSKMPYLPFEALFLADGSPNEALFQQIPDGAIIDIVRPNWDLTKIVGTHLNISHLGFAFWKQGTLMFRQASSKYNQVVEVPLIEYLIDARKSPTIQGISVLEVITPSSSKRPLDLVFDPAS